MAWTRNSKRKRKVGGVSWKYKLRVRKGRRSPFSGPGPATASKKLKGKKAPGPVALKRQGVGTPSFVKAPGPVALKRQGVGTPSFVKAPAPEALQRQGVGTPSFVKATVPPPMKKGMTLKTKSALLTVADRDVRTRVGGDYQAIIPTVIPIADRHAQVENEMARLVWKPTEQLAVSEIEEYISMAKGKFQYKEEQALGLLYWNHYEIQRATQDLANFTPYPEEWTVEDKVLFEQAFQLHGKCFDKFLQMLPDKSMSSLIRYYYSWKYRKSWRGVVTRQAKKLSQDGRHSVPGTNGSRRLLPLQGNISSNLRHAHSTMGIIQEASLSESDDDIMILEIHSKTF